MAPIRAVFVRTNCRRAMWGYAFEQRRLAVIAAGVDCGTILWESKRTRTWGGDWLRKCRDNQRAVKASCSAIVSQTLPDGVTYFDHCDGVTTAAGAASCRWPPCCG